MYNVIEQQILLSHIHSDNYVHTSCLYAVFVNNIHFSPKYKHLHASAQMCFSVTF